MYAKYVMSLKDPVYLESPWHTNTTLIHVQYAERIGCDVGANTLYHASFEDTSHNYYTPTTVGTWPPGRGTP